MTKNTEVRAIIDGRTISRDQLRAWESRRNRAVLGKLAHRLGPRAMAELTPDPLERILAAPLDVQRTTLTAIKTGLGHAGILAMLKRELELSDRVARTSVAVSRGRTKHAVTRLAVDGYSAERFAAWFDNLTATNDETAMIDACPDHYLLRGLPDGRQEVVETTGGSPAASRFLVDYTASDTLTIPIDPRHPIQIAGHAVLDDGLVIGGVRHQFRDNDGTCEALLTVQFPASTPNRLIHQHQWHLATEFSNWLIAAAPTAALI
ncbi:hypothetical protein LTV02_12240 [Nocardia yamanashiensis]|uniref:hypothetical protein n=1 Tax=Nocardia yamanashiensis TaxID=209247 RepID=UPI001E5C6BCA|nr:hypothetical protein [Nocardia yamanashiensis]UGT44103.1 hypothetical protein LTV02_12240 [Nocardia yamanashiensis]